jgi:hypothetical protein
MGFNRGMRFGSRLGLGRGIGPNMSFSCRWFPWLPRGWWRFPSSYRYSTPFGAPYPSTTNIPSFQQYPPMWPSSPMVQPGIIPPSQEREILNQNLKLLEEQLGEIQRRLSELETQE